jgi:hypothetical protein
MPVQQTGERLSVTVYKKALKKPAVAVLRSRRGATQRADILQQCIQLPLGHRHCTPDEASLLDSVQPRWVQYKNLEMIRGINV